MGSSDRSVVEVFPTFKGRIGCSFSIQHGCSWHIEEEGVDEVTSDVGNLQVVVIASKTSSKYRSNPEGFVFSVNARYSRGTVVRVSCSIESMQSSS